MKKTKSLKFTKKFVRFLKENNAYWPYMCNYKNRWIYKGLGDFTWGLFLSEMDFIVSAFSWADAKYPYEDSVRNKVFWNDLNIKWVNRVDLKDDLT